ncbi:MAG: helix-turn-helix domain-containing protein [Hydrogenothermaceae bacterium]
MKERKHKIVRKYDRKSSYIVKNGYIQVEDLPQEVINFREKKLEKKELLSSEKDRILEALSRANGNKTLTAKILGIDRVTLWRKMKRYGIDK